jgi:adenylate cyclase
VEEPSTASTTDSCTAAIVASRSSGLFLSRANARSRPKGDLEKIKTIGDAYMVAAGLPEPRSDHAQAAIEMAMAMQRHLETMRAEHPELRLRIGIHTGPVVAGVIGENKFTYDLWGDNVNIASRMESHGR